MTKSTPPINPNHKPVQKTLRIAGPLLLAAGLTCFLGGAALVMITHNFLFALLPFVGIFLLFAGSSMSMFGFMGAVARYQAQETAPVVSDTFNYVAEETQDGVRTMASAFREGLSGETTLTCAQCSAPNDTDASFCDTCGAPLSTITQCPSCGKENDPDARFCDACGQPLNAP